MYSVHLTKESARDTCNRRVKNHALAIPAHLYLIFICLYYVIVPNFKCSVDYKIWGLDNIYTVRGFIL